MYDAKRSEGTGGERVSVRERKLGYMSHAMVEEVVALWAIHIPD